MVNSRLILGHVGILGDSYSTFKDEIPKGYATYYGAEATCESGVENKEQTWWGLLQGMTNATIVLNSSYSGSTICNTGYGGNYCIKTSFVTRAQDFFNQKKIPLDTLFIFGGTNDSWAEAPIGELKYGNRTEEDIKSVLPAVCQLCEYLTNNREATTRIIFLLGTEVKPQITNGIMSACQHYGYEYIKLTDTDLKNGHPTAKGMQQIANDITDYIKKNQKFTSLD